MCFCTIPSNGHTSLSTALVIFACSLSGHLDRCPADWLDRVRSREREASNEQGLHKRGLLRHQQIRKYVANRRPSNILRNKGRRSSSFRQKNRVFLLGKYSDIYLPVTQNEPIFSISTSPNSTEKRSWY